ncbi:MAG: hypothetical protein KC912_08495 [Proteobacteria bacterium]|nr:hypothetical protein [Pseudomonadota bacterium]
MLFRASTLVLAVGVAAFASFAPVFWLFGLPEVVLLNLAIVVWLSVGIGVVRSGRIALGTAFGSSAVLVHGTLATLWVGWQAGFGYQVLVGMLVQALFVPVSLRGRGLAALLCGAVYIALAMGGADAFPDQLESTQMLVFRAMNLVTAVVILGAMGLGFSQGMDQARIDRNLAQTAAEQALRETHAIVEHMAEGLFALDADGEVRAVNRPLRTLLDLGDGAVGRSSIPNALLDVAEQALADMDLRHGEVELSGDRIGAAIASPIGEHGGAVVLLRDVTTAREVDRMKTQFTAVVSHELRTPLTSVLGFTRMIQSRLEQRVLPHTDQSEKRTARAVDQVRTNLDIILSEGKRLSALIDDVLDIAKMESGQMTYVEEPVDVAELITRTTQAAAALFTGEVALVTDVAEATPTVSGDFDRLLQVLLNLVSNAAKFTDEGEVRIEASLVDENVRIRVIDTGVGIPASQCAAIFDRFHQVDGHASGRPKGTGLGLPICRHIIEAHHGEIAATSEVGKGLTMTVDLPATSA